MRVRKFSDDQKIIFWQSESFLIIRNYFLIIRKWFSDGFLGLLLTLTLSDVHVPTLWRSNVLLEGVLLPHSRYPFPSLAPSIALARAFAELVFFGAVAGRGASLGLGVPKLSGGRVGVSFTPATPQGLYSL